MPNLDMDWQIDEFMVYCHSKELRPKTLASYEQALRLFERWCSEQMNITQVDRITESVIRHYISDLRERGKYTFYVNDKAKSTNCPDRRRDYRTPISAVTINCYIRDLRVFFNWLEQDYVISRNPMKKIRQLKIERNAKDFLSDEDFKRLVSALDKSYFAEHRDFAIIHLLLDSGMRLGECTCLTIENLELANRRIFLQAEITKGRKSRTVFFSPKTETILRRWLQFKDRYVESDYLFPVQGRGGHISVSNFETNFKKTLCRAGLRESYSPHCLRNNFAKRCLMSGMDIYTLSRLLGHSSVTVTEKAYLDITDDEIGKRYRAFSPLAHM